MDIKPFLDTKPPLTVDKTFAGGLELKLNQVLDARVIETQITLDTLTLKIADKMLTMQPKQALTLQPGQPLQLQVVKLLPTPEFKILPPPIASTGTPPSFSPPSPPALPAMTEALILKLVNPPPQPGNPQPTVSLSQLATGQQLTARIVDIATNRITLQLLTSPSDKTASFPAPVPPASAGLPSPALPSSGQFSPTPPLSTAPSLGSSTPPLLVTLDARQLVLPNTESLSALVGSKTPPATIPLTEGTQVNLQVIKSGTPPTFALSLPAANPEEIITEAFKHLLPIQASPAPLLNQLGHILPALENNPTVAEALKQLARTILRTLPDQSQLTEPKQLKQAIADSGLFLESKLAELLTGKTEINLQGDLKLQLHKLVQLLQAELTTATGDDAVANSEIFKESLQKTHAALAKLTLDQLGSLPHDESPKQAWILELPFLDRQTADSLQIEIEQDKAGDNQEAPKNWAVNITITPPNLATIHCRLTCYDGAVNTRFWSEAAGTVDKINTHLDYLKQQFELKGLTSGFMEAFQGKPEPTGHGKKPVTSLLNEKA